MKHLSIKLRITLLSALLTAAAALIAVATLWMSEQRMLRNYYQDSLVSTAQLAQDDIRYVDGALDIDRNLDELPNVRVALFTADGDLIYGRARFELPFAEDRFRETTDPRGERWFVYDVPLAPDGGERIWLRCYISSDAAQGVRGIRAEQLLILIPAIIALAGLGGYGIARQAFRPVARIAAIAESIAEGEDLKKRIALTGAKDELYRLARTFDGMLQRLEGAFERERRFTSDASHELRTPVAAILAQSEVALAERASEAERVQALRSIHASAGRMAELIRRLLYLSRMDARQQPMRLEAVDLALLLSMAAQSLQTTAAERGVRIDAASDGPAIAECDQVMLLQAVLNLLENAIRHGRRGGSVHARAEQSPGAARIIIEDDGPGIESADLERIFDRFYRADPARGGAGSGLGLPLARHVAHLHGGSLEAESRLGKGSRFTIVLPKGGKRPCVFAKRF